MRLEVRVFETDNWITIFVNDHLIWDGHRSNNIRILQELTKVLGGEMGSDYFPDPEEFARVRAQVIPEMERRAKLALGSGNVAE